MAVDFCYIISHGFTARMLLQTNLIGRLASKGNTIAIIAPDIKDENLNQLSIEYSKIELIEWNHKATIWDDDYLHKRMYFLEDLSRNTALKEKFYNGLFFSNSKHPWKRIRPLFYYLTYLLNKQFPNIRKRFIRNEKKHLVSEEATAILNRIEPKILISTYPVSIIEVKLLYAAKQKNIKTVSQLLSWDNISCKGRFPVLAEEHLVWGDIMHEELQEYYGINSANIKRCGVPHFDEHIRIKNKELDKDLIEKLNLNIEKPYLFLAMSSPRFAPREIDIVEWLSKAIEKNVFGLDMQLIVRPHPQNLKEFTSDKSWISRLNQIVNSRVAVDYPELSDSSRIRWSMKKNDMTRLAVIISGCTVSINSGSTVIIDSLLHDKPVVLTSFDGDSKLPYWNSAKRLIDYAHLKKIIAEGGAEPAYSYEDLSNMINSYISEPGYKLDERRNALYRECYLDDGKATERIIENLIALREKVIS